MINEKMRKLGAVRSVIRELFEYGKKRKAAVDTLSAEIILQNYIDRERTLGK